MISKFLCFNIIVVMSWTENDSGELTNFVHSHRQLVRKGIGRNINFYCLIYENQIYHSHTVHGEIWFVAAWSFNLLYFTIKVPCKSNLAMYITFGLSDLRCLYLHLVAALVHYNVYAWTHGAELSRSVRENAICSSFV